MLKQQVHIANIVLQRVNMQVQPAVCYKKEPCHLEQKLLTSNNYNLQP
jgi:hypothetical protein